MPTRQSEAQWSGDLKQGKGTMKLGSGAYEGAYSFQSRMESGKGTNPEELIAAAHAGCFSMALSAMLSGAGHVPKKVHTTAKVSFDPVPGGFAITKIALETEAEIPGLDDPTFQKIAQDAKKGCPVSKALAAVPEISLTAKLIG
jgi:osmotically inducible protein OsmC